MHYNQGDLKSMRKVIESISIDASHAMDCRNQTHTLQTEIHELQKQLLGLIDKKQAVSDDLFIQEFRALGSWIKSFSRDFEVGDMSQIMCITDIRRSRLLNGARLPSGHVISNINYLIEAYMWSILIQEIFDSPFLMLGYRYGDLTDSFTSLFGNDHQNEWPIPHENVERWKYQTIEHFVQEVGFDAIAKGTPAPKNPVMAESISYQRESVIKHIAKPLTCLKTNLEFGNLRAIVNKAFKLSLQMNLQRCRLQAVFPTVGDGFRRENHHGLTSVKECEDVKRGVVAFTVNPGLAKWGDTHGQNLRERVDLVPTLVYVQPPATIKREYID
ncbi:unnamed protein product [Periconia digitata]|uniref:Uncharacterized protein n=1 Tax=Periconia digitata TaxID=1303443 RepID=A0A9W4U8Z7_9PLEO|nr:unnamed protein product [Periconia digitata]